MTELTMQKIVDCLQEAVDLEMERKAKLGYNAVVVDSKGRPKVVSAKSLVRKRRAEKALAEKQKQSR